MLVSPTSDIVATTIYIRLLDEGTEVFRPSLARSLGDDIYELLQSDLYDPEDEHWEFKPGSCVRTEIHKGADGEYRIAASFAS